MIASLWSVIFHQLAPTITVEQLQQQRMCLSQTYSNDQIYRYWSRAGNVKPFNGRSCTIVLQILFLETDVNIYILIILTKLTKYHVNNTSNLIIVYNCQQHNFFVYKKKIEQKCKKTKHQLTITSIILNSSKIIQIVKINFPLFSE